MDSFIVSGNHRDLSKSCKNSLCLDDTAIIFQRLCSQIRRTDFVTWPLYTPILLSMKGSQVIKPIIFVILTSKTVIKLKHKKF